MLAINLEAACSSPGELVVSLPDPPTPSCAPTTPCPFFENHWIQFPVYGQLSGALIG